MTHDSTLLRSYSPSRRKFYAVIVVACLAGVGVSIELTRIHIFTHTDPNFHSLCAVSDEVNCETVALSHYSAFAGLPVSVWGVIGYLALGLAAVWGAISPRTVPLWIDGGLISLSTLALAVSITLFFISMTRIDSICLFCMASYMLNLLLFIMSVILVLRSFPGAMGWLIPSLRSFFSRPALAVFIPLASAVTITVIEFAIEPYWESPGWSDLPDLDRGIDVDGHHWVGAANPLANIIEFSDYECPHCRKAHKQIRLLAAKYPNELRLYHRHLPLDRACHPQFKREFHLHACHLAKAAECAGDQNKFWEMNDALFSIQDNIKARDVDVELLAVKIGLDRSCFLKCMTDDKVMLKIKGDIADAIRKGLHGTPTFFIDDKKFSGRIPESEIKRILAEKNVKTNNEER